MKHGFSSNLVITQFLWLYISRHLVILLDYFYFASIIDGEEISYLSISLVTIIEFVCLEQGSPNYGSWARYSQQKHFIWPADGTEICLLKRTERETF